MAPSRREDVEATMLRRCIYVVFGLAAVLAVYSQAGYSASGSRVPPLAARSPHGHGGHAHAHNLRTGEGAPGALVSGVDALASFGESLSSALRGAILGARVPTKIVRRSFRDEETGALVEEEAAYFSVPEGEGAGIADALRAEQESLEESGLGATAVDEIVLRRARASFEEDIDRVAEVGVEGGDSPPPSEVAAPAPATVLKPAAWAPLDIPTRPSDWVAPQRLVPNEREAVPASHVLSEATAHSLNPPRSFSDLPAADALELSNRLIISIAMGVHSGKLSVNTPGNLEELKATPPLRVLLPTFLPTAQTHHVYRFYFAYDHNDPVYENAANRDAIAAAYTVAVAEENSKRWHPDGAVAGAVDGSTVVVSVHWVHCEYAGKPGWAHSDAVIASVKEGADYIYRSNDDTEFPKAGDWVDRFVADLRSRSPVSNLGVTGPTCNEGATWCVQN